MTDDLIKKTTGFQSTFDKITDISKVIDSSSSLAAISGVTAAYENARKVVDFNESSTSRILSGIDNYKLYDATHISAKFSGDFYKNFMQSIAIKPIVSGLASVIELMQNKEVYDTINNSAKFLSSFSQLTAKSLIDNIKFQTIDGKADILADFSKITSNYNWRKHYSNLFIDYDEEFKKPIHFLKFNENLKKLQDLNILDRESTFIDGSTATSILDDTSNIDSQQNEQIYKVTNEAFEQLTANEADSLKILNKLYKKVNNFLGNDYTKGLIIGLILIIATYYITKKLDKPNEKLILESDLSIKQKPIKSYKDFIVIPTGAEVMIVEKFKVWAKVTFTNSDGIPQIGYCKISEIDDGAK